MAYFQYRGQLTGGDVPAKVTLPILGSQTITVGGAVKITGGYVAAGTAGTKMLGICVGLVDKNGIDLANTKQALDGTYTPGAIGTEAYAAASDNVTDQMIKAVVIIDKDAVFMNDTADTSIDPANMYGFYNLTSATQLADFTAGQVAGQMQLVGLDPDGDADASKGLFRIAESVLDAYTQC